MAELNTYDRDPVTPKTWPSYGKRLLPLLWNSDPQPQQYARITWSGVTISWYGSTSHLSRQTSGRSRLGRG